MLIAQAEPSDAFRCDAIPCCPTVSVVGTGHCQPIASVSVVIPTRNGLAHLKPCIDSLVRQTRYPNLEILVMDNQSDEVDTLAYLAHAAQEYGVRVIPYDHPFNYSAINNSAAVGRSQW